MKKREVLCRERVNRALESIFHYPMTVVEAPMGYGKTTAVREFLAAQGGPVLWLSFLSPKGAAAFFWDSFAREIGRLDEAAGKRLKSLGFPSDAPQTATILSILNELDFDKNTVLVIDDFHLAKDAQVSALLEQIVKEEPDNLYIVILTRDTTNLNFSELFAKGLYHIFPQQALRFTEDEIRDYCALMGFKPDAEELQKICEYTGGWISLVYLVLLGMEQGIPIDRNSVVDELVEKVLYNVYDESIQKFLLCISVMDTFTAEQALYVTEESRAGEFLKKLRRENAFVYYDEAEDVYKIHNVLLDFLRKRFADKAERAALYRRVGEWHLEHKAYITAYGYLCRAGETERVLSLLNNEGSISNASFEFEGAFDMFAASSRETLFKYPFAYLQYIARLFLSGGTGAMKDGMARLNELQAVYEEHSELCPHRRNRVLAGISAVRMFTTFNDAEKMVACVNEALRLLKGDVSRLMGRDAEFTFGSPHFLYTYYTEQGRLKETVDFIASEFPAFPLLADGCGTGCDYVTLAEYALETGDWEAAELNAFKAIYKAGTMEQTGIILCAGLTLVRLYIYQGKIGEALEHMRQLRADVTKENNALYNTTLELVEGYAYGCLARPDSIPEWLRVGDMSPARFMYRGMAFNYIVQGKAVLLLKDYIRLEMLDETFPRYFGIFHNQLGFLHAQIQSAAAKYRLYGIDAGCAALQRALDMARKDHIVLPFAEYAPDIANMVRHIAQDAKQDTYVNEVLLACEQYLESLRHAPQSAAALSERELEVLRLAAEGLKREEIAGRLQISAGTVKIHLEKIYRKLGTGGRVAAIQKAHILKIL